MKIKYFVLTVIVIILLIISVIILLGNNNKPFKLICKENEINCGNFCGNPEKGIQMCNETCVNKNDNNMNCGSCNNVCQGNSTCVEGNCKYVTSINPNYIYYLSNNLIKNNPNKPLVGISNDIGKDNLVIQELFDDNERKKYQQFKFEILDILQEGNINNKKNGEILKVKIFNIKAGEYIQNKNIITAENEPNNDIIIFIISKIENTYNIISTEGEIFQINNDTVILSKESNNQEGTKWLLCKNPKIITNISEEKGECINVSTSKNLGIECTTTSDCKTKDKNVICNNIFPNISKKFSCGNQLTTLFTGKFVGIVILNNYLPLYFSRIGILDENKLIINKSLALTALLYLVTGDIVASEDDLKFLKIILGSSPDEVIPLTEISQEIMQLSDSLIEAVIVNFSAIGSSSIAGFRGNFLIRDGEINYQIDQNTGRGSWIVEVIKESFDILLRKSPFSFTNLKYAWTDESISVKWNY